MKISLVVVVDEAGGIGLHSQLLCHLPADLKHFKALTLGKPVLMGRKTFESIGRPLPGRHNIVLTHAESLHPGVTCLPSLDAAWALLQSESEIMIIGGATLYKQTLPKATHLYLTRIHHQFEADTYFPSLNKEEWRISELAHVEADEHNEFAMTFYLYTRI